jgi:hypothetical protein
MFLFLNCYGVSNKSGNPTDNEVTLRILSESGAHESSWDTLPSGKQCVPRQAWLFLVIKVLEDPLLNFLQEYFHS